MKTHSLIQGSDLWHSHRSNFFNASDAAAMMGCSPYETRTQLLHRLKTGITPEVDAATQRRFDDGHRFEALARPLAEAIIGEDLYPVTGTSSKYSASFDGLSMDELTAFEHKSMNADLRVVFDDIETVAPEYRDDAPAKLLPLQYRVQMEQQCLVSGAERVLFMASKWDGDTLVDERHCFYLPDGFLRKQIVDGWAQLEKDLAAYTPVEAAPVATATPTLGLPAVSIQVNGSIALIDNLDVFGAALTAYIAGLNLKPETDQHFADLEGAVKAFKKAEDALEAAENGALAQTASIDTMRRTVAQYKELARVNRLMADKLVKSEKDNRRIAIVTQARAAFDTHVAGLNTSMGKPYMPTIAADFGGVVKGLKTITSIQNAVDTELARVKIEANATADRIRLNLGTLRELAANHAFLFADTGTIVLKATDDLTALVKTRISEHQAAEAAKEAATRERIRAEEQVKAEAAVREAERVKAEEVARLALEAEAAERLRVAKAQEPAANVVPITRAAPAPQAAPATPPTLKLGEIGARLGFTLTGEFMKTLGFEPAARDKAALLFNESDFSLICMRLVAHIQHAQAQRAA